MVRALSGWVPQVALPRRRIHWVNPNAEPVKPQELEFIRRARGRISSYALAECYGVFAQTISNICGGPTPLSTEPAPSVQQSQTETAISLLRPYRLSNQKP